MHPSQVGANAALSSFARLASWRESLKLLEQMRHHGICRERATSSSSFVRCNWTQPWKISSAEALTTVRLEDALIDPEAHKGVPCSTVDASLGSAGRYDVDMVCCIMLYFKYIYNTL